MQGGLERCLLLSSFAQESSKISSISMEEKHFLLLYEFLSGQHVADESDYKRSRNSQRYIDFSIAESRLCYKSAEICSGDLAKDRVSRSGIRLSENDIDTTTGKSKKFRLKWQKLISNPRTTLWEVTSLLSSLCSTAQAVLPAMLQIRFLQQQQVAAIKNNPSYQSAMYLNQNSIQERQWWFNNLDICNGKLIMSPTSKTVIQSDASKKGAYCQSVSTGDQWSFQESNLHISVMKFLSIKLALLTFSKMFNFKSVRFQVDICIGV